MAPWSQIGKPFSFHFAFNCLKTIAGAALIGHGLALAAKGRHEEDPTNNQDRTAPSKNRGNTTDSQHNRGNSRTRSSSSSSSAAAAAAASSASSLSRRYVQIASTIGLGLYLGLPALISQIVWETMIPAITATDIAYDLSTENLPSFTTALRSPKQFVAQFVPQKFPTIISPRVPVDGGGGGGGGTVV